MISPAGLLDPFVFSVLLLRSVTAAVLVGHSRVDIRLRSHRAASCPSQSGEVATMVAASIVLGIMGEGWKTPPTVGACSPLLGCRPKGSSLCCRSCLGRLSANHLVNPWEFERERWQLGSTWWCTSFRSVCGISQVSVSVLLSEGVRHSIPRMSLWVG